MIIEDKCSFFEVEQRLLDCLNLWIETKSNYFDPNLFRRSLNNCIQALRNVTWILQSNKSKFSNFDDWYKSWQERMRGDEIMRWLVKSRNYIVKNGDLVTHSKVRAALVYRWIDPPVFEMQLSPLLKTEQIAELLAKHSPDEQRWSVFLLKIERLWVDSNLPNKELLEILTHVFNVLSTLVYDAHNKLLETTISSLCPWYSEKAHENKPFMLAQERDRTIWWDLNAGGILNPTEIPFKVSEKLRKKAMDRYPTMSTFSKRLKECKTFEQESAAYFEVAKNMLVRDGYHIPIALLGYSNRRKEICPLVIRDRTEKHLMFLKLASDIEKKRANSVIIINETWIVSGDNVREAYYTKYEIKTPGREEALMLTAAHADGRVITYIVFFYKNLLGKINMGEEKIFTGIEKESFLIPILVALKKSNA